MEKPWKHFLSEKTDILCDSIVQNVQNRDGVRGELKITSLEYWGDENILKFQEYTSRYKSVMY